MKTGLAVAVLVSLLLGCGTVHQYTPTEVSLTPLPNELESNPDVIWIVRAVDVPEDSIDGEKYVRRFGLFACYRQPAGSPGAPQCYLADTHYKTEGISWPGNVGFWEGNTMADDSRIRPGRSFLWRKESPRASTTAATPVHRQSSPTPQPVQTPPQRPADVEPIDSSGLTWTDAGTGLIWQRVSPEGTFGLDDAKKYCQENQGKLPGAAWRLPTRDELESLVTGTNAQGCRRNGALEGRCDWTWSSSPHPSSRGEFWGVDFKDGGKSRSGVDPKGSVRCVRGE